MGLSVTICTLLVRLSAFAGWTLSASLCLGLCVGLTCLAEGVFSLLFFSIVSPNHGFQQELMGPPTPSLRLSAHTRVAPRRSPINFSVNPFREAEGPMQVPKTSRSLVGDQPLEFNTHLHGRIPIHSPPVAS
jgi:hypothetical protein